MKIAFHMLPPVGVTDLSHSHSECHADQHECDQDRHNESVFHDYASMVNNRHPMDPVQFYIIDYCLSCEGRDGADKKGKGEVVLAPTISCQTQS